MSSDCDHDEKGEWFLGREFWAGGPSPSAEPIRPKRNASEASGGAANGEVRRSLALSEDAVAVVRMDDEARCRGDLVEYASLARTSPTRRSRTRRAKLNSSNISAVANYMQGKGSM